MIRRVMVAAAPLLLAGAAAALAQDHVVGNSATTSAAIADFTVCTPGASGCGQWQAQQVADWFCAVAHYLVPLLGTSFLASVVANAKTTLGKLPPSVQMLVHILAVDVWQAIEAAQKNPPPAPPAPPVAKVGMILLALMLTGASLGACSAITVPGQQPAQLQQLTPRESLYGIEATAGAAADAANQLIVSQRLTTAQKLAIAKAFDTVETALDSADAAVSAYETASATNPAADESPALAALQAAQSAVAALQQAITSVAAAPTTKS